MMKSLARSGSRLRCVRNRLSLPGFFPFVFVGAEVDEFHVPVVHAAAIIVLDVDRFVSGTFLDDPDDVTIIVIIVIIIRIAV